MDSVVAKIEVIKPNEPMEEYTIDEYIRIPTATTVLFTIGENTINYYNAAGEKLTTGRGIMSVAKQKRAMMDAKGQSY